MLYKVKATYKYQAEDMDELAFEVGEIIQVVEYDDPEEQVRIKLNYFWAFSYTDIFRRKAGWWEWRKQPDRKDFSQQTSPSLSK